MLTVGTSPRPIRFSLGAGIGSFGVVFIDEILRTMFYRSKMLELVSSCLDVLVELMCCISLIISSIEIRLFGKETLCGFHEDGDDITTCGHVSSSVCVGLYVSANTVVPSIDNSIQNDLSSVTIDNGRCDVGLS